MQSGRDRCVGGHSEQKQLGQDRTWQAVHSLGQICSSEVKSHGVQGRTAAAVPTDWAQPWAEENLQHHAESRVVPESDARAPQGSREASVHGVEVADEPGPRTIQAPGTFDQTSSMLLGIKLSEARSTSRESTKPRLVREAEPSKLDSASERRWVSTAQFRDQSSFQPKTSRRGRLCPPGRGPSEALLSIAPFAAAGQVSGSNQQRQGTEMAYSKRSPESQKGEEPQGERDRETPTHTPKTPAH